jgi:hypothetical protein
MTTTLIKKGREQYFLTDITSNQKELIIASHKQGKLDTLSIPELDIDFTKIIKLGSKEEAKPTNLSGYVGYLKGYAPRFGSNRKLQYRDYIRTEEEQLKNAHLVATYEDSIGSAKSLIKSVTQSHMVLWYKEI